MQVSLCLVFKTIWPSEEITQASIKDIIRKKLLLKLKATKFKNERDWQSNPLFVFPGLGYIRCRLSYLVWFSTKQQHAGKLDHRIYELNRIASSLQTPDWVSLRWGQFDQIERLFSGKSLGTNIFWVTQTKSTNYEVSEVKYSVHLVGILCSFSTHEPRFVQDQETLHRSSWKKVGLCSEWLQQRERVEAWRR